MFWRRKTKDDAPAEDDAGQPADGERPPDSPADGPADGEPPADHPGLDVPIGSSPLRSPEPVWVDPASVPAGWEPDPADFEDRPPATESPATGSPDPGRRTSQAPIVEAPEPAMPAPNLAPSAVVPPEPVASLAPGAIPGWISPEDDRPGDLAAGLEKSRTGFIGRLRGFLGAGPEGPSWDDVEETLIAGDVGASLAIDIVERARARRDPGGSEAAVRAELAALLVPRDPDGWRPQPAGPGLPAVILVVGVNGTGKTTTIGKLASRYHHEGLTVLLAAADTFRAAAIEQLTTWAERSGSQIVAHAPGADPGAVVFDALDAAVARRIDVVIADTAGRLHTKVNLMDELAKIRRIVDKRLPGAQPETLFVLDATTGQNGLAPGQRVQ